MICNHICPYNTYDGCNVEEKNGVCPMANTAQDNQDTTLTKTGHLLFRKGKVYEVVIADDNIFVVCPWKYSKKEDAMIVKYSKPSIYSNQSSINSLSDLGFSKC